MYPLSSATCDNCSWTTLLYCLYCMAGPALSCTVQHRQYSTVAREMLLLRACAVCIYRRENSGGAPEVEDTAFYDTFVRDE